jgi:magnesium transporter
LLAQNAAGSDALQARRALSSSAPWRHAAATRWRWAAATGRPGGGAGGGAAPPPHLLTARALASRPPTASSPVRWLRADKRPVDGDAPGSAEVYLRPEAPASVPLAAIELTSTPGKPRLLHLQKADAAAALGLMVRDMRAVDATFRSSAPTIVSRDSGIIVHLQHIRVIVTTDKVLVFDPANPDVEAFIPRLQSRLLSTSHPMPFELRAVEGVLVDVCASLNAQLGTLTPSIDLVLDTLSTTTDFGGNTVQHCLDRLLPLEVRAARRASDAPRHSASLSRLLTGCVSLVCRAQNALNEFSVKVDHVRRALHDLLASDEDMATMYLTTFRDTGRRRPFHQHDEVEMMLENYVKQIDTVHSEVTSTLRAVKATENVTQIRLDAMRNRILRLEVFLNLGAVSVATGGLVAGAFGMNLKTGIEETPGMFLFASGTVVVVSVLAFRLSLAYLRYKRIFR